MALTFNFNPMSKLHRNARIKDRLMSCPCCVRTPAAAPSTDAAVQILYATRAHALCYWPQLSWLVPWFIVTAICWVYNTDATYSSCCVQSFKWVHPGTQSDHADRSLLNMNTIRSLH